jgi:tetratricopeptide (TPR) repeat protein
MGLAPASAKDATFIKCLATPEATDEIVRQCTAVIESATASPLDKALALNNRAVMAAEGRIADMDEAVKLAPKIPKLWHNRGLQWLAKDEKRAIEYYSAALRLDPHYAVAWTSRGEAWAMLGEHDKAIADFDEAIKLAPRFMHAMYNPYESRALSKESKGDLKGAEADRQVTLQVMGAGKSVAPGPNASGLRQWEPFIAKQQVPKDLY